MVLLVKFLETCLCPIFGILVQQGYEYPLTQSSELQKPHLCGNSGHRGIIIIIIIRERLMVKQIN